MSLSGIHLNKKAVWIILSMTCLILLFKYTSNRKSSFENKVDLRNLLNVAVKASENGGFEVVRTKDNLVVASKGKTKEGANDQVTSADFLSHCSMIRTLKFFFPNLLIISEEAKTKCEESQEVDYHLPSTFESLPEKYVDENDITIWIDPLDATQEYTEKLFKYVTTMVCVAVKGEPVIGVIHNPFSKQTSWSWVGHGKSPDLSLEVSRRDKLKIVISRSHSGTVRDVLNRQSENSDVIEAGGAGYKTLLIATGQADAYVHTTAIKKWDICAGNAILKSVGGNMTTKYGEYIDYSSLSPFKNERGLVATYAPQVHKLFVESL